MAAGKNAMGPARKVLYEKLSKTCVAAAEAVVGILRRMREDRTLSSLILFDCNCIGEAIDVFIMALQRSGDAEGEGQAMLRFCWETFKGMEQVGWCEKLSPEFEATVHESGFLEPNMTSQPEQSSQSDELPLGPCGVEVSPPYTGTNGTVTVPDSRDL